MDNPPSRDVLGDWVAPGPLGPEASGYEGSRSLPNKSITSGGSSGRSRQISEVHTASAVFSQELTVEHGRSYALQQRENMDPSVLSNPNTSGPIHAQSVTVPTTQSQPNNYDQFFAALERGRSIK